MAYGAAEADVAVHEHFAEEASRVRTTTGDNLWWVVVDTLWEEALRCAYGSTQGALTEHIAIPHQPRATRTKA